MFHKYIIIVPKNKKAEKALDYDQAKNGDLMELFLTKEEFYILWNADVFDLLNEVGDAWIDEYEEGDITSAENLQKSIQALQAKDYSHNTQLSALVNKLIQLMQEALKRGVGIYFYF